MSIAYGPFFDVGTAYTWTSSGGDKVITATSLASGSARQGDKSATFLDGTKGLPAFFDVKVLTKAGSAVTNGLFLGLYMGESNSATAATDNPGGLTGADGSLANPAEITLQLRFLGAFPLSNALGTGTQTWRTVFYPRLAYQIPVLVNSSGQTLSATGTDHQIILTPYYNKVSY
jgi:hypothetical protein